jgi:hypothetical protein
MNKSLVFFLVFILFSGNAIAQKRLNNYAYIIVPDQFAFQNSKDQYQLNSLTKFLFEKEGVKVFSDTERIPKEFTALDCAGLKMKMNKKSSMFKTKVDFDLIDCSNNIIFTSELGTSNEKEYKKGYQTSIRNAFKSFSEMNYAYSAIPLAEVSDTKAEVVLFPKKEAVLMTNPVLYSNEAKLVIELTKANGSFIGKVSSSASIDFTSGEVICKLFTTSLPTVFKAQWKDSYGNFTNTIAYFNEADELIVDFSAPTGITIMRFTKQ